MGLNASYFTIYYFSFTFATSIRQSGTSVFTCAHLWFTASLTICNMCLSFMSHVLDKPTATESFGGKILAGRILKETRCGVWKDSCEYYDISSTESLSRVYLELCFASFRPGLKAEQQGPTWSPEPAGQNVLRGLWLPGEEDALCSVRFPAALANKTVLWVLDPWDKFSLYLKSTKGPQSQWQRQELSKFLPHDMVRD